MLVPVKRDGYTAYITVSYHYRLLAKTNLEIALLGYDVDSVRQPQTRDNNVPERR